MEDRTLRREIMGNKIKINVFSDYIQEFYKKMSLSDIKSFDENKFYFYFYYKDSDCDCDNCDIGRHSDEDVQILVLFKAYDNWAFMPLVSKYILYLHPGPRNEPDSRLGVKRSYVSSSFANSLEQGVKNEDIYEANTLFQIIKAIKHQVAAYNEVWGSFRDETMFSVLNSGLINLNSSDPLVLLDKFSGYNRAMHKKDRAEFYLIHSLLFYMEGLKLFFSQCKLEDFDSYESDYIGKICD